MKADVSSSLQIRAWGRRGVSGLLEGHKAREWRRDAISLLWALCHLELLPGRALPCRLSGELSEGTPAVGSALLPPPRCWLLSEFPVCSAGNGHPPCPSPGRVRDIAALSTPSSASLPSYTHTHTSILQATLL